MVQAYTVHGHKCTSTLMYIGIVQVRKVVFISLYELHSFTLFILLLPSFSFVLLLSQEDRGNDRQESCLTSPLSSFILCSSIILFYPSFICPPPTSSIVLLLSPSFTILVCSTLNCFSPHPPLGCHPLIIPYPSCFLSSTFSLLPFLSSDAYPYNKYALNYNHWITYYYIK